MQNELFSICSQQSAQPEEQQRQIICALKAGANLHATDKNGVTALHHAVRFRSPAAVQALIAHGADVNVACRRNLSTPLHRTVTQTGAPGTAAKTEAAREIIELLLQAGADPSRKNKSGKRPCDYTTDEKILALLSQAGQNDPGAFTGPHPADSTPEP